ncbi:MAG: Dps family protein [Pseudomonas sp.]
MPIDSKANSSQRQAIGDGLSQLLADTYVLFLKTHRFHWGVSGPTCSDLGLMLEEQYAELATALDAIAERLRLLGFPAPGTTSFYARLSSTNPRESVPSDDEMIKQLIVDQETVLHSVRALLEALCSANDPVTVDLLTQRMHRHQHVANGLCVLQRRR